MADNIESKAGGIPQNVRAQFDMDCNQVVKLKARNAREALKQKYSKWGLLSDEMWVNMLREMGFSEEERKVISECDRYYDLLKTKPAVVRSLLIDNLDRKYQGSKPYEVFGLELKMKLGLVEGENELHCKD